MRYSIIFLLLFNCKGLCTNKYSCYPEIQDPQTFKDNIQKLYPNRYTDQYLLNYYNDNKEEFNKPDIWMWQREEEFIKDMM